MTYRTMDRLANDAIFGGRVRACAQQQADHFKDDGRAAFVALAKDVILGGASSVLVFIRIASASPGIADKVVTGLNEEDPIDQSQATDADLLAIVQGNWQLVAALFFDDDGTPIERKFTDE